MKRIVAILAVVALVGMPVLAADEAAPAAKDMVLKGKITKTEAEKDGKNVVTFTLATADAKIDLPVKEAIKDDMLNTDVDVTVKAVVGADKKVMVKEVVGVKKAEMKKEEAKKEEAKKEEPKK